MKRVFLTILITGFLMSQAGLAGAEIIAAKFHADWCASCKMMAPAYDEIVSKYEDHEIDFVTFDKTDEQTSAEALQKAQDLGIEEIYQKNKKTGFVLLIDEESKEVRGKLTKGMMPLDMAMIVDRVLAGENIFDEIQYEMYEMNADMKGGSHKGSHAEGSHKGSH